jgi:hypothetical protein
LNYQYGAFAFVYLPDFFVLPRLGFAGSGVKSKNDVSGSLPTAMLVAIAVLIVINILLNT